MNQINFNNEVYFETPYDKYYISKNGIIISLKHKNIRILSYKTDNDGYFNVTLSLGHRNLKYMRVHRLVLETFAGFSDLPVNHKNGNKQDNSLDNLEYCTASENNYHRYRVLKYVSYNKIHINVFNGNRILYNDISFQDAKKKFNILYLNNIRDNIFNDIRYSCLMKNEKHIDAYFNGDKIQSFNNAYLAAKFYNVNVNTIYRRAKKFKKYLLFKDIKIVFNNKTV